MADLRQSDGLLHLELFLAHSSGLNYLSLLFDNMILASHIEGPLRIKGDVNGKDQLGYVLTRSHHSLMADTGDNLVHYLNVWRIDAW